VGVAPVVVVLEGEGPLAQAVTEIPASRKIATGARRLRVAQVLTLRCYGTHHTANRDFGHQVVVDPNVTFGSCPNGPAENNLNEMASVRSPDKPLRLARRVAPLLLVITSGALAAGGILHGWGSGGAGNVSWSVAGAFGAAYALWSMVDSLRRKRLGVDVIAFLALIGALGVGEYLAGAVIGVMVASGRALESWAAGRAHRDLRALLERTPRTAHRYRGGALETVDLDVVVPGDLVMVASGELVPVDGVITTASAVFDESPLTGEALPVERMGGDPVRSGVVNAGGPFDLRATTNASNSTYSGLVRLVSEAESAQAPFVRLADRYALWFLTVSLAAAGSVWAVAGATRAVAVLVVATPCPLILAAPVAFVSGLSRAARRGVVVKNAGVLERLARCTTLLIDKTGTLTVGHPTLTAIVTAGPVGTADLLMMAGSLDQVSPHLLASAVVKAANERNCELLLPDGVEEIPGRGIRGVVGGHSLAVGRSEWVGVHGTPTWAKAAMRKARFDGSLTVFVSVDGEPAGVLIFEDPLRADAARTIRSLRRSGIERVVMVTGDRAEVADTVAAVIGVDAVIADSTPEDKVHVVRLESGRAPTVMVGDGINDAPALALADVGVAMGVRGATASSEAADVVLTVDRLDRLGEATALARRTRQIAVQSVIAGMAMSLGAMGLAGVGLLPAVWGALLQEGIDVAVIINALRALRPGSVGLRLASEDVALMRRFQGEHLAIRADLDQVRLAAEALDFVGQTDAMARVRTVHRRLVEEVEPHEQAEENLLYPALGQVLGGSDPTGTMSRAHVEIAHRIRRLGQVIEEIGPDEPDEVDIVELRRILYGLHAILELHTDQEDESYLSLGDESGSSAEVVVEH